MDTNQTYVTISTNAIQNFKIKSFNNKNFRTTQKIDKMRRQH